MCIINDPEMLKKERAKTGRLMLWKVIRKDNYIGLWSESQRDGKFHVGSNEATAFAESAHFRSNKPEQFYCFFSRKLARWYKKFRGKPFGKQTKIIKVHVPRRDIVSVGTDGITVQNCISVSKLTIKSLKHQR